MGDYEITNYVLDYQRNRRIGAGAERRVARGGRSAHRSGAGTGGSMSSRPLNPGRSTAVSKLTGMQVYRFGVFFKSSWRANDWMWGRLDGAGWLVHVLLDPRRILAVLQAEDVPAGQRAEVFLDRLQQALDPGDPLGAAQPHAQPPPPPGA
jgi:hypothetical protein